MVCDLDSTDPEGWENDHHVLLDESTDSAVWELHVKDFSYDPASGVSEANRGKYMAFTETGTTLNGEGNISTCIDYLKELGVTTVQINPFYDFRQSTKWVLIHSSTGVMTLRTTMFPKALILQTPMTVT